VLRQGDARVSREQGDPDFTQLRMLLTLLRCRWAPDGVFFTAAQLQSQWHQQKHTCSLPVIPPLIHFFSLCQRLKKPNQKAQGFLLSWERSSLAVLAVPGVGTGEAFSAGVTVLRFASLSSCQTSPPLCCFHHVRVNLCIAASESVHDD